MVPKESAWAEKALRPLERAGWRVIHEVQNGHGNYDHIAVGPPGVFLLESKKLQGIVSIEDGVPHLARRHDAGETVVFDRLRSCVLANAAGLKEQIEEQTAHRMWVQAAVVFWSEFPDAVVEEDKCVFIEGSQLCDWLRSQDDRLDDAQLQEIAAGVERITLDGGQVAA